ncbi:MAG: mannose-1-phosphate guanylyltransferase/mannose-6-phosphate isomerase, partial [Chloroflexi bacterium]|nr:mannose-1-phosphate guanylyltransferase/mannose-6-phosphate isomerase [Chloroflexota bacterium]
LWPLSRELYPKQFLPLMGDRSLLQDTLSRIDGVPDIGAPIIVCNEEHRFLAAESARQLGITPAAIALEPVGRNTAPALTLASLMIPQATKGSAAEDPVMLVMPADHLIEDVEVFRTAVSRGATLADSGTIVTFGIEPDAPETGYGYIRKGEHISGEGESGPGHYRASAFVEKPEPVDAQRMVDAGEYLWNSGIFMVKASIWLQLLGRFRSDILEACRSAHDQSRWDGDFYRPEDKIFSSCPSDSIDYAVMERVATDSLDAPMCVVVPLETGWSDLGAWSTIWSRGEQDADGNVIRGDVYARGMKNSLIFGEHRLVTAVGLEDIIVVETADAVLVTHMDSVQGVKDLVGQLKDEGRTEQINHRRVHRPWGFYETIDAGAHFRVKRLEINPGAALSLQTHEYRAEHWVVVEGTAKVTRGDEEFLLAENQSTYVPVGMKHRLENPGTVPVEIIEVQTGSYLEEDDIVRFEDRYNRHKDD